MCGIFAYISKDKMQEKDVAAGYPDVVKKLQAEFDAYHAIGKPLIQEPVRFIIGDPRALVQELTSQDVYWTQDISSGQAFGQGNCEKLVPQINNLVILFFWMLSSSCEPSCA